MRDSRHAVFERVDDLIDRSPSLADLRHHRIELLAARRRRELGLGLPASLVAQERLSAAAALAAPVLLERVRAASDGPLVLFKGPQIARLYPDRALRSFRDLDLLVADAHATQRGLLAAGFREVGDPDLYERIHHLRPLHWPGLPLIVEIHHSPKWVDGLDAPAAAELIEAAVPCPGAPEGVLELPSAHHALVLAAHAWAHRPLSRLRDLLDIRLVADGADPSRSRDSRGRGACAASGPPQRTRSTRSSTARGARPPWRCGPATSSRRASRPCSSRTCRTGSVPCGGCPADGRWRRTWRGGRGPGAGA